MPVDAYLELVYCKASSSAAGSSDKVDGIMDFTLSFNGDVVETTDFKDGGGYKTRLQTVKDSSIDMSGQYESGDAVQQLIRTSWSTGATIYVTIQIDPSASSTFKGFQVPCLVSSYDSKGAVSGVADFSAKFVGNGAPTAV